MVSKKLLAVANGSFSRLWRLSENFFEDMLDAYRHFLAAAERLDVVAHARSDVLAMARTAEQNGAVFSSLLIRECSPEVGTRRRSLGARSE